MAHLWISDEKGGWSAVPLDGGAVALTAHPPRRCGEPAPVELRHAVIDGEAVWAVLAAPGAPVRVNGLAVTGGIRVLTDRDEIAVGGAGTVFFSAESLARVEPFPGAERTLFCPRCKLPVEPGAPAVRCPACSVWHHQSEELPCWTYAAACALCPQPTDLAGGFRWTPEEDD